MGRDNFSKPTKKHLANAAGLVCSNPNCGRLTYSPEGTDGDKGTSIGVAAHITAASSGGPRYDAELTAEQRASASNGLWLCKSCEAMVDDAPDTFTASELRDWKAEAERRSAARFNGEARRIPQFEVELSAVHLARTKAGSVAVHGTTNLPTGTRLFCDVHSYGRPARIGGTELRVLDGGFFGELTTNDTPVPHVRARVKIYAYFTRPWRQPIAATRLANEDGSGLKGECVVKKDPECQDSIRIVQRTFVRVIPPLELPDPDESAAIKAVKEARLIMYDEPSHYTVEWITNHRCGAWSGLEALEWSAAQLPDGSYDVTFQFINGHLGETDATWNIVMPDDVIWRNTRAKDFSWGRD